MSKETTDTNRRRGTTALGTVLCSVGGLFLLLSALLGVTVLLQSDLLKGDPGARISITLTMLSRLLVLLTGILVLRRSRRSEAAAFISIGVILLAGACDVALHAAGPADPVFGKSVLVGSLSVLGLLIVLLVISLIYLRRPPVREEFAHGPVESLPGA